MKQKLFSMFLAVLGLVVGTIVSQAATFYDFEMDLRDANGGILTADEVSAATTTSFGFSVAEGGTITRTTVDDSEALGTITGKTGNNHGLQSFVATVKVSGQVKITMSTCSWGGEVTVKDANNETVATFTTKKGECGAGCYKGNGKDDENIISAKYLGDATTLTISGGGYVGYFAVEEVQAASADVSYSLGDAVCSGTILPTGGTYAVGDEYTIPANNYTLYKEGYTLTAWTDGTNNYAVGSTITLQSDLALTPVFTENTVSLADRTEPVTLKWNFRRDQGAPVVAWQNTNGNIWVTQATINNETIDVPMIVNTNPGKFNNSNNTDCAQTINGTLFTIPSCKGAVVSMECHGSFSITTTTIDGQTDYTGSGTANISYEIASTAETIDIVIGDGSYYRYIQTVLPVVQQSGGTTYTDEEVTVTWAMTSQSEPNANTVAPEGVVSIVSFDTGTSSIVGTGNITNQSGTNVKTGIKVQAASSANDLISWNVKPAAGLTFTPVKVSGYINRAGTDVENGIKIYASKEGEDKLLLGTYTAWRSGNSSSTKTYDASAVYMYEITLTSEQQSALTSADGFKLYSTVGAYNETSPKQGIFGEVTITGTVSGTVADVETFTLAAAANIADGGTVTKYPNADEYDEGTEVTLTATKNFGYNFVNWFFILPII